MNILIVNDDGWGTPGITTLARLMATIGQVTVVAPDGPRSAFSSKVSMGQDLYLNRVEDAAMPDNVTVYTTNGTPADCVKLAINVVMKDTPIDLLVSGINHGDNCSINIVYSGTMGAAFVAAENGIPAIGFSLSDHDVNACLSDFARYIPDITRHLTDTPMPAGVCYNVNAPVGAIRGLRWTRQARGHWQKEIADAVDGWGQPCYRLVGEFVNDEPDATDTDVWAVANGYISIQPVTVDMTAYEAL